MFSKHQLPAYSPLATTAFLTAVRHRLVRGGEEVARARALVEAEFTAERAVLLDSGRSALRLAIELSLPTPPARRLVALPAFQCYEVATAAVGADCEIVLYDVDPATLTPDLDSLEGALRLGASAVVIAPLYGLPVDWDEIAAISARHGAVAIEDAAQAHGAMWRNRRVGSLGDLSVVSFGRGKGWTGGGGGALLMRGHTFPSSATDATDRLPHLALHAELRGAALTLAQIVFGRSILYGIPAAIPALGLGETRYHEPTAPARAAPLSAALIRQTRDAAAGESLARRENAAYWRNSLSSSAASGVPAVSPDGTPGYLRFPLRVRDEVARALSTGAGRRAGIARGYPRPLDELPAVASRLIRTGNRLPGAEALARELVTLPTHSQLTERNRRLIIRLFGG